MSSGSATFSPHTFVRRPLAGFNNVPMHVCDVLRPEKARELAEILVATDGRGVISRGLGRSYGDSALNEGGGVVLHERLNRFLSFDEREGVVEAEGGVSFAEIIETFLPRGLFPPVTPGTKFVTLGGAIAHDVHGKNHHRDGSISSFILDFRLLTGAGEVIRCSRDENSDIFWATLGGLGLTGMILSARLRLLPVETGYVTVRYERARDLDDALDRFSADDARHRYSVAWIDCLASGASMGRSVLMRGDHTARADLPRPLRTDPLLPRLPAMHSLGFNLPGFALNPLTVGAFNALFYARHRDRTATVTYDRFFYPLDSLLHWNRLYGRRGYLQYQAVLPPETSRRGLALLLERLARSRRSSFLAVLKSFGKGDDGLISFPHSGHTLALDLPMTGPDLITFLRELDALVLDHGGRIYLAKDACAARETVEAMYPRLPQFLAIKRRLDPHGRIASSMARRLGLLDGMKGAILIVGATSAIARACALGLAARGHRLVLAARDLDEAEAIAADARVRFGCEATALRYTAEDLPGADAFFAACLAEADGPLDGVLIAHGDAGSPDGAPGPAADTARLIAVNFTSAGLLASLAAAHLEPRRTGWVAAISSVAGDRGRASNAVYGASKAGLTALLSGLRQRLARSGVRVLTIKPGFIDTAATWGRPGLFLVASPERAARDILRAIDRGRSIIYTPWFWRWIMLAIRMIPEPIFKRLRL